MDKLLTRFAVSSVLLTAVSLSYAQDVNDAGYYISAKVAAAKLKADNMETSLRPGIGQFIVGKDKKDLTNTSFGFGYDFGNGWRTEGEYTFKNNAEFTSGSSNFPTSLNHHKVDTQRLMLNAYRDFEVMQNVAVYGNLGLGVARTESSGWQGNTSRQYLSNTETQLVYSIGAGASYKAIDNLNLDLGYRYVDLGKADSGLNNFANARSLQDEQMKAHLYSSEFYLGARYSF
ncbi:outer membrane beta-barrel protein [Acinetobacter dispersus]|uniref:outer membrane protein n=1 Tax=Acinetobacter dispersus TaxID=70348 RepID=UPI001F4BC321|nr:outer membrane beta-barrel protein [Acinetobacter dispersus]MCH7395188.1 outer membrane beta-barrel protein [Acinetobacter dispersus]